MSKDKTAIFVMPAPATGDSGPVASWISIAQWADAARRVYGDARIVTPEGVLSPEEVLVSGSSPSLKPKHHSPLRRRVPVLVETAAKGEVPLDDVPLVWQYHYAFQNAGFDLARKLDVPIVLRVNAPQVWEARQWGVRRPLWGPAVERFGETPQFRSADVLACVSEEIAHVVQNRFGRKDGVLVVPNGVDAERFSPAISGESVRSKYDLQDKFVVGWTGSFRPFHGVDLALEAVAKLGHEIPELTLLLVGDGQTRRRTEELARSLGLRNVVFTGTVPFDEMAAHVAAMDLVLLPARKDPAFHYSPVKLWEYMAAAKPIVAAEVGQVATVLENSATGCLVTPGDVSDLVESIRELHDDPDRRRRLGAGARAKVLAEWTWDRQFQRVLNVLN
jgi:glycosyltransferase involved in cell wall biosynthesis